MKKIINIAVLIAFLFFLFVFFNENRTYLDIFQKIKFSFILIFLLLNLLSYTIKSFINIYIFRSINITLSFIEAFNLSYKNTVGNLLGPLKAGSGYKLHYMYKNYDVSPTMFISTNTAYAAISILINLLILLLIIIFKIDQNQFSSAQIILFLLITFGIFILSIKILIRNIDNLKINFLKNFAKGFVSLFTNKALFLKIIIITLIFTFLDISILFFIFSMYEFNIDFISAALYTTFGSFASLVKITPGNIGVYELIMISTSALHGIETGEILSSSIFSRAIGYLTIILIFLYNFVKSLIDNIKKRV